MWKLYSSTTWARFGGIIWALHCTDILSYYLDTVLLFGHHMELLYEHCITHLCRQENLDNELQYYSGTVWYIYQDAFFELFSFSLSHPYTMFGIHRQSNNRILHKRGPKVRGVGFNKVKHSSKKNRATLPVYPGIILQASFWSPRRGFLRFDLSRLISLRGGGNGQDWSTGCPEWWISGLVNSWPVSFP